MLNEIILSINLLNERLLAIADFGTRLVAVMPGKVFISKN